MEVKDINIVVKLGVFTFIIFNIIRLQEVDMRIVALILCYLASFLAQYSIKKKYKGILTVLEGLTAIIISLTYEPLAIILLTIIVIENILIKIKNPIISACIAILPLVLIKDNLANSNIILITFILLILYANNYKNQRKIVSLQKENDSKRKEIYTLQNRLKDEKELLNQYLYTVQLQEKNVVPESVHDKVGQTMSGALMQLEIIKLTINNNTEQCIKLLDIGIKNLKDGMYFLKESLKGVQLESKEQGINKIKVILEEKTKNTMFKYTLTENGDLGKITDNQWAILAQTTLELTNNVIKYSTGNLIEVNITVLNKVVKFEIKDDGKIIKSIKKGVGLRSIEEKVTEKGGKMIINIESGFSVILLMNK